MITLVGNIEVKKKKDDPRYSSDKTKVMVILW